MQKKYTCCNKMTKGGRCMNKSSSLKRSLGVWSIVSLGLGYMTPNLVFDTFGILSIISNGLLSRAYLTELIVMSLSAISYEEMWQLYPECGSPYSYTRTTMGSHLGFFVG